MEVVVKVISVDRTGKIRLSRKEALGSKEGDVLPLTPRAEREERPRGDRERGGRERRGGRGGGGRRERREGSSGGNEGGGSGEG